MQAQRMTKKDLRKQLEAVLDSLTEIASQHVEPKRLIHLILQETVREPRLLECTPLSLVNCAITLCRVGVYPGGPDGLASIVWRRINRGTRDRPNYVMEAQVMIQYRGLIAVAARSKAIRQVEARVVYDRDTFDMNLGTEPSITHRPYIVMEQTNGVEPYQRGDHQIRVVYVVVTLADGTKHIDYMPIRELEGIKARSDSPAWRTDLAEMCKKTVVHRAWKLLPIADNPELSEAIGAFQDEVEIKALPAPSPAVGSAVMDRIRESAEQSRVVVEPTGEVIDEMAPYQPITDDDIDSALSNGEEV